MSHHHYVYVYADSPGWLGGWVYDQELGTWTLIGAIQVGTNWYIDGGSSTWVEWYAANPATCSEYPRADVFFAPPYHVAYNGSQNVATSTSDNVTAGTCPSQIITYFLNGQPWKRHIRGST